MSFQLTDESEASLPSAFPAEFPQLTAPPESPPPESAPPAPTPAPPDPWAGYKASLAEMDRQRERDRERGLNELGLDFFGRHLARERRRSGEITDDELKQVEEIWTPESAGDLLLGSEPKGGIENPPLTVERALAAVADLRNRNEITDEELIAASRAIAQREKRLVDEEWDRAEADAQAEADRIEAEEALAAQKTARAMTAWKIYLAERDAAQDARGEGAS